MITQERGKKERGERTTVGGKREREDPLLPGGSGKIKRRPVGA